MAFSVIILAVLWALQFIFLGSFYKNMKLNEIRKTGDNIVSKFDDADFHSLMNEHAFKNNLRIILLNEAGQITWNFDGFPSDSPGMMPPGGFGRYPQDYLIMALQKLDESNSNRTYYLDSNKRMDMTQSVYIAKVIDNDNNIYYLYISSPIPSIDSTVSVLQTQFIIITIIIFILSIIASTLISKKLSRPIINLTKSADRLVKGEFDASFYEDGFLETQQLASALNYATNELRSLDSYRKELLANVSHDLKTPITIIKFYAELIRDVSGSDPEKREDHCDTIIKEANWLADMVGEILETSKLEARQEEMTRTKLNLSQLLTDIVMSFQDLFVNIGYTFEVAIEDDLLAYANEPMIKRALYNLISNAINFTGEDKTIYVSLKTKANNILFEVRDTGEGIPKEKQSVIWDRYYKSEESHKRALVGSGLGLSIVKNILIQHESKYGVTSQLGKGSTFWFEIEKA